MMVSIRKAVRHYSTQIDKMPESPIFTLTSALSLAAIAAIGFVAFFGSKVLLPKSARWQDRAAFIWLVSMLMRRSFVCNLPIACDRHSMRWYVSRSKALSFTFRYSEGKSIPALERSRSCVCLSFSIKYLPLTRLCYRERICKG
jgi:hypothetical protein